MNVLYTVNNYILGAKVEITQTDKIISQRRIDKAHTKIIYAFDDFRQKEFCDKVLARNGKVLDD